MKVLLFLAVVLATCASFVVEAIAQMQAPPPVRQTPSVQQEGKSDSGEEKTVQGQVKSIDAAEKEITLTNGTQLVVPPDAKIRPGMLREGTTVIAKYKEEGGKNVLTALAVVAPSPPSDSPGSFSPLPSGRPEKRY
jgi:hypothetical protein